MYLRFLNPHPRTLERAGRISYHWKDFSETFQMSYHLISYMSLKIFYLLSHPRALDSVAPYVKR